MIPVSCSWCSRVCVCDTGGIEPVLRVWCVCGIQLVLGVCVRYQCHTASARGVCVGVIPVSCSWCSRMFVVIPVSYSQCLGCVCVCV